MADFDDITFEDVEVDPESPSSVPVAVEEAAHDTWQVMRDGGRRRATREGMPGWLWYGSRDAVITDLWPDLPSAKDHVLGWSRFEIGAYLKRRKITVFLGDGTWWVRDNWPPEDMTGP